MKKFYLFLCALLACCLVQPTYAYEVGDIVPYTAIEAGAKYHLKHVESGLYLQYLDNGDGDFCINALPEPSTSVFEFEFTPIAGVEDNYYLNVTEGGSKVYMVGSGWNCQSGTAPNGTNSQIELQLSGDGFVMKAVWSNFLNFNAITAGNRCYANKGNDANAAFQLELAVLPPATVEFVSKLPANDATNVDYTADLTATFNKTISLIENPTATIVPSVDNVVLSTTLSVLTISADFAPATPYTVTVPAGTVVGYDSDITWSFTTAAEVIMPQNGKSYNIKY